jgi:hypothetical protein
MLLEKHLADPHGDGAAHLPLHQVTVEHPAAVLDHDVAHHAGNQAERIDLRHG